MPLPGGLVTAADTQMYDGNCREAPRSANGMQFNLVGGFNHLEKYESQWEGLSHILWKIKAMIQMFQNTNQ